MTNALAAVAIARHLGLDDDVIQAGLSTYKNAPMRQQIHQCEGFTLIDDSYNASPEATKVSLDVLKSISKGKSIAVLADMLELGEQSAALHRGVGEHLALIGIDTLIAIGEHSRNTAKGALDCGCKEVYTADSNDEAYAKLRELLTDGCKRLKRYAYRRDSQKAYIIKTGCGQGSSAGFLIQMFYKNIILFRSG